MRLPPLLEPKLLGVAQAQNLAKATPMSPHHINSMQWQQAIGYARQACARIFRDGGSPAEACRAFGLTVEPAADWGVAVDRIALALCAPAMRKAA